MIWNKNVFQNYTLVGEKAASVSNAICTQKELVSVHVVVLKFIFSHPQLAVACAISHAIY